MEAPFENWVSLSVCVVCQLNPRAWPAAALRGAQWHLAGGPQGLLAAHLKRTAVLVHRHTSLKIRSGKAFLLRSRFIKHSHRDRALSY